MKECRRQERHTKAGEMLELVDLTALADRLPDQLSAGNNSASRWPCVIHKILEVLLLG
jgi:putative spermidine/putrescine transport system ATP-binding protein